MKKTRIKKETFATVEITRVFDEIIKKNSKKTKDRYFVIKAKIDGWEYSLRAKTRKTIIKKVKELLKL